MKGSAAPPRPAGLAKEPSPERWVHRGHVDVAALLYDRRDEAEAAQDIINRFQPGLRVYRVQGGILAQFAEPVRMAVVDCPGLPLVRQGQRLLALPMSQRSLDSLSPASAHLWRGQAGALTPEQLQPQQEIDPADWLDLSDFVVLAGEPLPSPPRVPESALADPAVSVRQALGSRVGEAPSASKALSRALRDANDGPVSGEVNRGAGGEGRKRTSRGSSTSGSFSRGSFSRGSFSRGSFSRAMGRLAGIFEWVANLLVTKQVLSTRKRLPGRNTQASAPESRGEEAPASPRPSLLQKLRSQLLKLAWRSRLGAWLGAKHAVYLQELFELFDSKSFDEALRRAIPAGKGAGGSDGQLPFLPGAERQDLALGKPRGSGASLGLQQDLFHKLEATYRRAFDELNRQGRHLEAAFVLSELLQEDEQAVEYLETKELFADAARLAEARGLAPGLSVRLWFLAGEVERALSLAVRDGAFEEAVARLNDRPQDAKAMRLLWAEHLASSGNYGAAVEVAAQLPEARALCLGWLERAQAVGGVVAARALVLQAQLQPEAFPEVRQRALQLLDSDSQWRADAIVAMAERLVVAPAQSGAASHAGVRALARSVTRAVLRDQGLGLNRVSSNLVLELARKSGDGVLAFDVPALRPSSVSSFFDRRAPLSVLHGRGDVGSAPCYDACVLPDDTCLVARGEAGCVLLSPSGAVTHRFDVPARRLVISDAGVRVLALIQRGPVTAISQIDLSSRRAARWIDLELTAWCDSFDGALWYAATADSVFALDVHAAEARSLWTLGPTELPGPVQALQRGGTRLSLAVVSGEEGAECWEFDTAPHRLRQRRSFSGQPVLGRRGDDLSLRYDEPSDAVGLFRDRAGDQAGGEFLLIPGATRAELQAADEDWLVVVLRSESADSCRLWLVTRKDLRIVMQLDIWDSEQVRARLSSGRLVVADAAGRTSVFELLGGACLASHRL